MPLTEFNCHVAKLRDTVLTAVGQYFDRHAIPFSPESFLEDATVDLDDLAKDALFHGAEVFPIAITTK